MKTCLASMLIIFAASGCGSGAGDAPADAKTVAWDVGTSLPGGGEAWDGIVLFPADFDPRVKPWVIKIADLVRKGDAKALAPYVRSGDTASQIISYWRQYSEPKNLYFRATYNSARQIFTLSDTVTGSYSCSGTVSGTGWQIGSCRVAASASECSGIVFVSERPSTRVVLLNGDAASLFEKYKDEAARRRLDIAFKQLEVYLVTNGRAEKLLPEPLSQSQIFTGMTEQSKWLDRLRGRMTGTIEKPHQEAARLRADLVCN